MNDIDIQQLFSRRNEYRSIRYDLANIRILCGALGDPQDSFRSILIAGTNGKGVVARWIASMLPEAGLFVSPHLVRLNERISVGGVEIDNDQLQVVHDDVQRAADDVRSELLYPPTYFEIMTAMAFHYFQGRTRYGVIEVGLGGRLDATNIVAQDVSVITSIGLDHQEYLGTTLEAIAAEKAGIIKTSEPVVIGKSCDYDSIRERAAARLIEAGNLSPTVRELGGGLFDVDIQTQRRLYGGLRPRIAGRHQVENLCVALCAAEAIEAAGWPVNTDSIRNAINTARWPGRLEVFDGRPSFILDGGHNVDAIRAIARYLGEYHPEGVTLVFGSMVEKDYREMLEILVPHARNVILTRPRNERAVDPAHLQSIIPWAVAVPSLRDAVEHVRAHHSGDTVMVAGSLYLAGEARSLLTGGIDTDS